MMEYIVEAFKYITSDPYFCLSMGLTTSIGMFVGAVIYDGLLRDVKKAVIVLISYAFLLGATTLARVLPKIPNEVVNVNQPFAGVETIIIITIFYILGMWFGVKLVNKAGKKR